MARKPKSGRKARATAMAKLAALNNAEAKKIAEARRIAELKANAENPVKLAQAKIETAAAENRKTIETYIREAHKLGDTSVSEKTVVYAMDRLSSYTEKALDGVKIKELAKNIKGASSSEIMLMGIMLHHTENIALPKRITANFIAKTLVDYAKKQS